MYIAVVLTNICSLKILENFIFVVGRQLNYCCASGHRTHIKEKFLADLRKARDQYQGPDLAKVSGQYGCIILTSSYLYVVFIGTEASVWSLMLLAFYGEWIL